MQIEIPQTLIDITAPWGDFVEHSKLTKTIVIFLHIAPIVVGGGIAIGLDRLSLRLSKGTSDDRGSHLAELSRTHNLVIWSLGFSIVSGLALVASEIDNFPTSWIFWVKMGFIVLLLLNGVRMKSIESRMAVAGPTDADWTRLHSVAISSISLWLIVTFLGVALSKFA
ncbi:MAG: hypothetical protein ABIZ36_10120 [Gemmatimonadaceae bacterium]